MPSMPYRSLENTVTPTLYWPLGVPGKLPTELAVVFVFVFLRLFAVLGGFCLRGAENRNNNVEGQMFV